MSKCLGFIRIVIINDVLRADECVDIQISVKIAVNLSFITTFGVMDVVLIYGMLQLLSEFDDL